MFTLKKMFSAGFAFSVALAASAQGPSLEKIISTLADVSGYHSRATVEVQLPQGTEVTYGVEVWSSAVAGDTLAPCEYLIEWGLSTPSGMSEGFSAYNGRSLFRHSDSRLQEYHYDWDSIPFLINGGKNGVQRNTQFTNLLPQFIAEQIRDMIGGKGWTYSYSPDTVTGGQSAAVLKGRLNVNGYVGKNVLYVFNPETCFPRNIEIENNPTTISEQILVIKYSDSGVTAMPSVAEADLAGRYPEVFENYRENNFSAEMLKGKRLPAFSLPTTTAERYQHQRDESFRVPTIIAFIDPSVATAAPTVEAIRNASASLPRSIDAIYAFNVTDIDAIEQIVPSILPGEHLLSSAKGFARDCGIASWPTIIIADTDGSVSDVIIGYSNDLLTKLIEKASLAK